MLRKNACARCGRRHLARLPLTASWGNSGSRPPPSRTTSAMSPRRSSSPLRRRLARKPVVQMGGQPPSLHSCLCPSLAKLWRHCLRTASLPSTWTQIRVSLASKRDGTFRPLSVASALWRICASATSRRLRRWLKQWAGQELFVAVPGRSISDVHLRLSQAQTTAGRNHGLAGAKVDLRKRFDTVDPELAIRAAQWLGLPPQLAALLATFHSQQERYLTYTSIVNCGIRPSRGLLQGCPLSTLLLNAVMRFWTDAAVGGTDTDAALFVDDRSLWTSGRDAVQKGAEVDDFFGLLGSAVHWHLMPTSLVQSSRLSGC